MSDFKDDLRASTDESLAVEETHKKRLRELLGFYLGSILHEDWKEDDRKAYEVASDEKKNGNWEVDENGVLRKFKFVNGQIDGKDFEDKGFEFVSGNPAYRADSRKVDIRALTFDKLPIVWQKENADAGRTAIDLLFEQRGDLESVDVEAMAAEVHKAWLERPNNKWAKDYQAEESKPYEDLSPALKQKDRRHVELAIELLRKLNKGEIDLSSLESLVGPSYNKFMKQLEQIKGERSN